MPRFNETSKTTRPPAPPGMVARGRLHDRLEQAVAAPLTLLSAGPGSGKTVLLSGWAAESDVMTAWASIDPGDNNPQRLWSLVGDALLSAGVIDSVDGFGALPHEDADAAGFLSELLSLLPDPVPVALIIDDAHHLTEPTVLAELDAVVRYGLPRLRLVLSSRSDPLLPLHRYRLAGLMHELRAADLAMTEPEAQALMSAHGVHLSGAEFKTLQDRTEGWAAGLRLSAMRMAESSHPAQFVSQLSVDEGSVGEYLMQEVLNRQPEEVRRLLVQTSVLDDVNGPLACAISGIEESSELLAELSRTNSFVVRLDGGGDHYRYHQLLHEILHYLVQREYPEQIAEFYIRGAAWYQEEGDAASAMRYAAKADDWLRFCQLLIGGGFAAAFVERRHMSGSDLRRLLNLDPLLLTSDSASMSSVRIAQAAAAVLTGDVDAAAAALAVARANPLPQATARTALLIDVLVAYQAGQVPQLDHAADRLLEVTERDPGSPQPSGLRAAVRLLQATAHLWQDTSFAEAQRLAELALADAQRVGEVALELEALGLLQLLHINAGRGMHAEECREQSAQIVRSVPHLQRGTVHHLADAWGALMSSDSDGARRALGRAEQTKSTDADPPLIAAIVLVEAWLLLLSGHCADAHQLLQNAPELKIDLPGRLARTVNLTLADVETRLGRPNSALKALGTDPADVSDPVQLMMAARAALDLGDADAAEQALRPVLIASDEELVSLPMLVYALLMSARAAELRGDDAKAVAEIVRATQLASDTIVQPFVGAREQLKGVLSRHADARNAWPEAARLDPAELHIPGQPTDTPHRPLPKLANTLTERETSVLRRLSTSMTIAEIADEMFVSVNTIKTHVASIYRKLPAAGRRDAVARARQLELL